MSSGQFHLSGSKDSTTFVSSTSPSATSIGGSSARQSNTTGQSYNVSDIPARPLNRLFAIPAFDFFLVCSTPSCSLPLALAAFRCDSLFTDTYDRLYPLTHTVAAANTGNPPFDFVPRSEGPKLYCAPPSTYFPVTSHHLDTPSPSSLLLYTSRTSVFSWLGGREASH